MDLISIGQQDSGEYLCRVVSSTGVAESRATLGVTRKYLIIIIKCLLLLKSEESLKFSQRS